MDAIIIIIFPEYTLRKSIYTGEHQPLLSPLIYIYIYIYIKGIYTVEQQPKAKNHLPQRIHPVTVLPRKNKTQKYSFLQLAKNET